MTGVVHSTKAVRGYGLRLTALGPCGELLVGALQYEMTDFASVVVTPNVYAGVEIKSYNAQGQPTLIDTPTPYVEYDTIVITTDIANPVLQAALGGGAQMIQVTTLDVLGFKNPGPSTPGGGNMALEVWQRAAGAQCGAGGLTNYVHVFPLIRSWQNSNAETIGDQKRDIQWTGKAYENSNYGHGPVRVLAGPVTYADLVTAITGPHDEFLTPINPPSTAVGVVTITPLPAQS